jgi:hypothetical protein
MHAPRIFIVNSKRSRDVSCIGLTGSSNALSNHCLFDAQPRLYPVEVATTGNYT